MSDTSQTNDQEREEATPEQVAAMRAKLIKYYRGQNELLSIQAKYEENLACIAESKCKTFMYTVKLAQMTMGSKVSKEEEEEDLSQKKREEVSPQTNTPELKVESKDIVS